MNIITLIAILTGTNWSTTCVMTQANQQQGYTIDRVQFQKSSLASTELNVTFIRSWYKDDQCKESKEIISNTTGTVNIGNPISDDLYPADWKIENTVQLGVISYDSSNPSIRLATTSFGNSRNTMLSLFKYFAK